MAFRKLVGSYKDYDLSTHIIEDGYLCVDVSDGTLKIGDGTTAGGTSVGGGSASGLKFSDTTSSSISIADGRTLNLVGAGGVTATVSGDTLTITGSGSSSSLGDLTATGSTLTAPSNGDLTLKTAGTGVVLVDDTFKIGSGASVTTILDEDNMATDSATALATQQSIKKYVDDNAGGTGGISFTGTVISTTDSSPGIEITGNLIPSADGVYQLGSSTRRWQTAYLSSETLDIGGATISSDGTGSIAIAATGATFPAGSLVADKKIMIGGAAGSSNVGRPVQAVGLHVSDGSTTYTDAQLLAKTATKDLEFNGTVEGLPTYTEAGHAFILASGATLSSTVTSITLFQF